MPAVFSLKEEDEREKDRRDLSYLGVGRREMAMRVWSPQATNDRV